MQSLTPMIFDAPLWFNIKQDTQVFDVFSFSPVYLSANMQLPVIIFHVLYHTSKSF